jgi:hypothetical protein
MCIAIISKEYLTGMFKFEGGFHVIATEHECWEEFLDMVGFLGFIFLFVPFLWLFLGRSLLLLFLGNISQSFFKFLLSFIEFLGFVLSLLGGNISFGLLEF